MSFHRAKFCFVICPVICCAENQNGVWHDGAVQIWLDGQSCACGVGECMTQVSELWKIGVHPYCFYRCCSTEFCINIIDLLVLSFFCLQNMFIFDWILSQFYSNIRIVLSDKPCLFLCLKLGYFMMQDLTSIMAKVQCFSLIAIMSTTAVMGCPSQCRLPLW